MRGLNVKPRMILAALAAAVAACFAATAVPAQAAVSSASIDGGTATLNLDGADDNVTVSVSGGLLVHGQTTGGLNSGSDWDSATPGDQTVPGNGTFSVVSTAVTATRRRCSRKTPRSRRKLLAKVATMSSPVQIETTRRRRGWQRSPHRR